KQSSSLYDLIFGPLKEPLDRVGRAAESFEKLATTYDDVGREIKDALAPRTPEQVDSGTAPPNLRSVIARLDSAGANVNRWLGDDAFRGETTGLATKLSNTADAWTKTAQTLDDKASRLGDKLDAAADQATVALRRVSDASEQVSQFTAGVNRGEG